MHQHDRIQHHFNSHPHEEDDHEGEEMYKRSIIKAELLEVSPCTFPAYDSSQINCRSFERMKADAKEEQRLEELRKEARLLEIADKNNKE